MSVFTKEQTEALKRHADKHYEGAVFKTTADAINECLIAISEFGGTPDYAIVNGKGYALTKNAIRDELEHRNRVLKEATDEVTRAEREYARKGNKASEPFTGWDDDE